MWSVWVRGVNPVSQGVLYSLGPSNSAECFWQISTDKLSNTQAPFQHGKGCSHSLLCSVTLCAKLFEVQCQRESVGGWEEFGGDKSSVFVTWIFWGWLRIFFNLSFQLWGENPVTNVAATVFSVVASDALKGKVKDQIFIDFCTNTCFIYVKCFSLASRYIFEFISSWPKGPFFSNPKRTNSFLNPSWKSHQNWNDELPHDNSNVSRNKFFPVRCAAVAK